MELDCVEIRGHLSMKNGMSVGMESRELWLLSELQQSYSLVLGKREIKSMIYRDQNMKNLECWLKILHLIGEWYQGATEN